MAQAARTPVSGGTTPHREKVTIADLAAHLSLSKGTVSRALNKYPDISRATQERVAQAAAELGYVPSPHARALTTGVIKSAGLVLNVDRDNLHKPFLSDFLDGISLALTQAGWTLSVATAASLDAAVSLQRSLLDERRVDGFILPRTLIDDPRVALMQERNAPFVMFGRTGNSRGAAWYDIDGAGAMAKAVTRLAGMGHRHIAYVGGGERYMYQTLRKNGFLSGMGGARLAVREPYLLSDAMTEMAGFDRGMQLLDLSMPPTAIVCATDLAALGVCRAISERGLIVGEDISIIAYDGIPEAAYARPPLTSFSVNLRQAGERLAALLMRRVAGEPAEDLRELAQAELVCRASDGPPVRRPEELAEALRGHNQNPREET